MGNNDLIAYIAGAPILIFLIVINIKVLTSKKKVLYKITFLLVTSILTFPVWYISQFAYNFILANFIYENKAVNCVYLNENSCNKRPDCQLVYPDNIGSKPICIYKTQK